MFFNLLFIKFNHLTFREIGEKNLCITEFWSEKKFCTSILNGLRSTEHDLVALKVYCGKISIFHSWKYCGNINVEVQTPIQFYNFNNKKTKVLKQMKIKQRTENKTQKKKKKKKTKKKLALNLITSCSLWSLLPYQIR